MRAHGISPQTALNLAPFGSDPNSYYWEVWDPTSRVTKLFGAVFDQNGLILNTNALLRGNVKLSDPQGVVQERQVIAAWGLSQEYDNQPAKSGAVYEYESSNCETSETWQNLNCFHALRIKRITYNSAFGTKLAGLAKDGQTYVDFNWEMRKPVRLSLGRQIWVPPGSAVLA